MAAVMLKAIHSFYAKDPEKRLFVSVLFNKLLSVLTTENIIHGNLKIKLKIRSPIKLNATSQELNLMDVLRSLLTLLTKILKT